MFDVIVVGARGVGALLSMLLARRGHKVLLVEKGSLSSQDSAAHYIHPIGAAALQRWGLLEELMKSGSPPIHKTIQDLGEFRLAADHLPYDGITAGFCPRAGILDSLLVGRALEAGVEVRENFAVSGLHFAGGHVAGIRGQCRGAEVIEERAPWVVGADGVYSIVARAVAAQEYAVVEPLTCQFSSLWADVKLDGRELYPRVGRFITATPTHDEQAIISVFAPRSEFRDFRGNLEGRFFESLHRAPEFAERVERGKRASEFTAIAESANYFRVPHGPGWALVGNAGLYRDSITAHRLTDAWRDAELLDEALHRGLTGAMPMNEALDQYQQSRDATAGPLFRLTCEVARLAAPDAGQQFLLDALREDPEQTRRYFAALAGTIPLAAFFESGTGVRDLRKPEQRTSCRIPQSEAGRETSGGLDLLKGAF